jgi:hypothetical protein
MTWPGNGPEFARQEYTQQKRCLVTGIICVVVLGSPHARGHGIQAGLIYNYVCVSRLSLHLIID